jgi:nitroimidazol reductase NimA-like FMN-containing flavoprotein (pyridoxamine 5'-phosphate oxidase superfamily)
MPHVRRMKTSRTTLHRKPARGSHDPALVYRILDEALVAHVGFVADGEPFVIPMFYARMGDQLLLHGAAASRTLGHGADGVPLCVTVTLLDGLVLARTAFHHSVNYRSVVLFGTAHEILDADAKIAAAAAFVDHMLPGRSREARLPNHKELNATRMLALPIREGSAKVREGGPIADDPADRDLACWAGHVPIGLVARPPIPDPTNTRPTPPGLVDYRR